jgi:hypothetical protein
MHIIAMTLFVKVFVSFIGNGVLKQTLLKRTMVHPLIQREDLMHATVLKNFAMGGCDVRELGKKTVNRAYSPMILQLNEHVLAMLPEKT